MSTSTVFGLTAYHQQEEVVKTKRTLMAAADRKVLLIDSSKFGKASLIKLAALRPASLVRIVVLASGLIASEPHPLTITSGPGETALG